MSTHGNDDAETGDEHSDQSVEERLADLEEEVQYLRSSRDRYREEFVKPRIQGLEERSDDAGSDRAELRATVEGLQETVATLQQTLENMIGVDDPANSTPEKRRQDLVQAMIRRAQASDEKGVTLWWEEVQNLYADLGHGEVCRPSCYDDMDTIADRPVFEEATKVNGNGNEVTAIRLDSDELQRHEACSDPTTQELPDTPAETTKPTNNPTR